MKRVYLLEYFELAETLKEAKASLSTSNGKSTAADIYFGVAGLDAVARHSF